MGASSTEPGTSDEILDLRWSFGETNQVEGPAASSSPRGAEELDDLEVAAVLKDHNESKRFHC
jgi:hypothetical protein